MLPKQYTSRTKKKDLLAPTKAVPLHRLVKKKVNSCMMLCLFLFALGLIDIFQTELLSWTKKQVKVVQNVELNVIVKKVEEKSSPEVITTNSERTALFTTPSKQETPTAYLNAGQKLNVQKVEGEWYGVKGPKQNILWLHKEQITPESDA